MLLAVGLYSEPYTASLEALQLYSAGVRAALSSDPGAARPLLERAIVIDPKFAMAYAFLGRVEGDMEPGLAAESLRKAYALRERASDRERFFIDFNYELQATGNLERAQRTGELWETTYPRDREPPSLMAWVYQELGKYEPSAEAGRRAIEIDADFPPGYTNLAWADVFLGKLPEAEATLRQAEARKIQVPDFLILRYCLGFLNGDHAAMERAAARAKQRSGAEDWMAAAEAGMQAYHGRFAEAQRLSRRATDLARQGAQTERAAMFLAGAAVRAALFDERAEARRMAAEVQALSSSREVSYGAALALALAGDTARAEGIANNLSRRFPQDTCVRSMYVPVVRALAAVNGGDTEGALAALRVATPYELAVPGSWFGFYGNLYPVYVRGLAYLRAKRGGEATAEFQKMLAHRGNMFDDPADVAARLELARAQVLAGGYTGKAAYRDFLALWKEGDRGLALRREAEAEYANLP